MGMRLPEAAETRSLERMFAEMDAAGVTRIVVPGRKAKKGGIDNQDILTLAQQYPQQITGIPAIDPLEETALREIRKLAIDGPCPGIIVEPGMLSTPLYADDEKIYPVYQFCQEQGLLLVLAVGSNAGPDQTYAMPQHVEQVAIDFPRLTIIVTHGCWPWTAQACQIAFRRDNVYLSPDLYLIHTPGCEAYITAANYMCREKILYGTSYPFARMKDAVDYYRRCGIEPEALEYILYRNVAGLLHLDKKEMM